MSWFSSCCCSTQQPSDVFLKFTVVVESINFYQQNENIPSRFTDFTLKMSNGSGEKETALLNCLGERNIDLHPDDVYFEFTSRLNFGKRERASREAGGRLEWRSKDQVAFEVSLYDDSHQLIRLKDGSKATFTSTDFLKIEHVA